MAPKVVIWIIIRVIITLMIMSITMMIPTVHESIVLITHFIIWVITAPFIIHGGITGIG